MQDTIIKRALTLPCCTFRHCDAELSDPKHNTFTHRHELHGDILVKKSYVCDGGENENNGLRHSSHLKTLEPS